MPGCSSGAIHVGIHKIVSTTSLTFGTSTCCVPPSLRRTSPGKACWGTLKTFTVAEVEKLYDDRRFANTWEYKRLPGALHPEWFEIPGSRQEVMRLHATNALRWSQSESVVAATSRMPWAVKKPQQDAEWTRYTTCWLQHPTSLLRIPSELHEICFWILSCANHHPSLRSFHAIFNGKRDGSFKIQRLCDLHCTPQLSSNGLVAVQFCCPRLDAVLGR